jgi:Flp pilus assembly pilin Flp
LSPFRSGSPRIKQGKGTAANGGFSSFSGRPPLGFGTPVFFPTSLRRSETTNQTGKTTMKKLLNSTRAASITEYAVLTGILSVAIVGAVIAFAGETTKGPNAARAALASIATPSTHGSGSGTTGGAGGSGTTGGGSTSTPTPPAPPVPPVVPVAPSASVDVWGVHYVWDPATPTQAFALFNFAPTSAPADPWAAGVGAVLYTLDDSGTYPTAPATSYGLAAVFGASLYDDPTGDQLLNFTPPGAADSVFAFASGGSLTAWQTLQDLGEGFDADSPDNLATATALCAQSWPVSASYSGPAPVFAGRVVDMVPLTSSGDSPTRRIWSLSCSSVGTVAALAVPSHFLPSLDPFK